MVAGGGIEPPTRGFSVAGPGALAARNSKIRESFSLPFGPARAGPNSCRTTSHVSRLPRTNLQDVQRVADTGTELKPSLGRAQWSVHVEISADLRQPKA